MPERRYTEHEIADIFEQAAHAQEAAQKQASGGLTLAELQEIGASAGIDPAFIQRAAAVVDHTPKTLDAPTLLGIPIGVGRTIDLPGEMTDAEWQALVSDLRMTFNATGKQKHEGAYRQWSNGNLRVTVEPIKTGHRVRFRTVNGRAQGALSGGGLLIVAAVALLVVSGLMKGFENSGALAAWIFPALFAAWMVGSTLFQLPAWRRTRAQQMEALAARLVDAHVPQADAEPAASGGVLDLDALLDAPASSSRQRSRA